jgi:hypothetical protein
MRDTSAAMVITAGSLARWPAMALQKARIRATVYEAYCGPADGIGGLIRRPARLAVADGTHASADILMGSMAAGQRYGR